MKVVFVLLALCVALVFSAENAAIKIDMGEIVGTTINDPKACRGGEACLPLVGIAGEGFNLRRGSPIFTAPVPTGIPTLRAGKTGALLAAIDATTSDSMNVGQLAINKLLTDVPVLSSTNGNSISFAAGKSISQRPTTFDTAYQKGDAPFTAPGKTTPYSLGSWLSARASGLIRCQPENTKPYAVLELWFENLIPQGMYSMHFVYNAATAGSSSTSTKQTPTANFNTQPVAGSSSSYFVANGDGKAYIHRVLPGNTYSTACFYIRDGTTTTTANNQPTGIDVRYHSSGIALGAVTSSVRAFSFAEAGDLFAATGAAGTNTHLQYGHGSHSHVTLSYPETPAAAATSARWNIAHSNIDVSNAAIV